MQCSSLLPAAFSIPLPGRLQSNFWSQIWSERIVDAAKVFDQMDRIHATRSLEVKEAWHNGFEREATNLPARSCEQHSFGRQGSQPRVAVGQKSGGRVRTGCHLPIDFSKRRAGFKGTAGDANGLVEGLGSSRVALQTWRFALTSRIA